MVFAWVLRYSFGSVVYCVYTTLCIPWWGARLLLPMSISGSYFCCELPSHCSGCAEQLKVKLGIQKEQYCYQNITNRIPCILKLLHVNTKRPWVEGNGLFSLSVSSLFFCPPFLCISISLTVLQWQTLSKHYQNIGLFSRNHVCLEFLSTSKWA